MALQLFKIASTTVESPTTGITFNSIPSGYTDLLIKVCARSNRSANDEGLNVKFNGSTANFTIRILVGNGSTTSSSTGSYGGAGVIPSTNITSNVFGNSEIYIPNYTSSNYKSYISDSVEENNATYSEGHLVAGLWSNTAAITQVDVYPGNSGSFVANSTATLYGVL